MSYATSIEEVLWGITLVAVTMAIHGCGMLATLFTSHALKQEAKGSPSFSRGVAVLILASWMIVLIHLVELLVWAAFFVWQNAMPSPSTSYYFALMQYTTVGSSFNLPLRWRLLDGMLPIAGLMTFAWSTGVLFTLAQDFQSRQLSLLHRRREARQASKHRRAPSGQAGES
jgi:voltage-gated potassium channel